MQGRAGRQRYFVLARLGFARFGLGKFDCRFHAIVEMFTSVYFHGNSTSQSERDFVILIIFVIL